MLMSVFCVFFFFFFFQAEDGIRDADVTGVQTCALPILPWVESDDNFAPLRALAWQVHVYGEAAPEIEAVCRERKLALHVFPWRPGLRRNAVYLVRPDGYVALADPDASAATLQAYLEKHGLG